VSAYFGGECLTVKMLNAYFTAFTKLSWSSSVVHF